MICHVPQVILAGVGILVTAREVVLGHFKNDRKQGQDLGCKIERFLPLISKDIDRLAKLSFLPGKRPRFLLGKA
jgi:hypothetical protein